MIKLIVGLGNPGHLYRKTRHNVGFMLLERVAKRIGARFDKRYCKSRISEVNEVILAKPYTFVNLSGKAIKCLLNRLSIAPQEMLVVCDDVALPLGRIRIRRKGSDGGHNGLRSIINEVGTEDFPRLRIGIGREGIKDLVAFVLGEFSNEEKIILDKVLKVAIEAVECILREGLESAMNKYNPLFIV